MSNAPKNISQDRESQQTQSAQTGMQSTMENEEPQLLICKKPNFEQKSTTHDQLTINEQRKTKRKLKRYNVYREGKVDRGRMIYARIPTREHKKVHGLIKYDEQKEQWKCNKCTKTVDPQNQGT